MCVPTRCPGICPLPSPDWSTTTEYSPSPHPIGELTRWGSCRRAGGRRPKCSSPFTASPPLAPPPVPQGRPFTSTRGTLSPTARPPSPSEMCSPCCAAPPPAPYPPRGSSCPWYVPRCISFRVRSRLFGSIRSNA
eukprot:875487-Prorocentrum_minimum.AAC.1